MTTQVIVPVDGVARGFDGRFTGAVDPNVDGSVTIDSRDLGGAIEGGFLPAFQRSLATAFVNPAAANATTIVANATAANGALTIANQPDFARQLQIVNAPGSPGITAGSLAVEYVASDGTTVTDTFSLIGASTATLRSTKGALSVTSAIISNKAGGTSPTIQIGTNATLAVNLAAGSLAPTIVSEFVDGSIPGTAGALTSAGLYTPNTAPNGAHDYIVTVKVLGP